MTAFIGQAQIGDFKEPGRRRGGAAGLVVLHPDGFQGAGLLALAKAQRQSHRPGLVLLARGGKELLLDQRRGDKAARSLWEVTHGEGLSSFRCGLQFIEALVPAGRRLLYRQGQGQQERRHRMPSNLRLLTFWARTCSNCRLSRSMTLWGPTNSTLGGRSVVKKELTVWW